MNIHKLKNLDQKKRFSLLLILIYIISLPVISTITYFVLRQNAINHAYEASRLYIAAVDAVKQYVEEELRPVLKKELPHKFILEGMSRSYAAGSVIGEYSRDSRIIFSKCCFKPEELKK